MPQTVWLKQKKFIFTLIWRLTVQDQDVQNLVFETPWIAACQASLSSTISWGLLKLISIEAVMSSNHLILSCPLLLLPSIFSSIRIFSNESILHTGDQSTGAWASTSVLPVNIQDWSPLGLTGLISLQSKGLSRVFSSTTVQKHKFFGAQPSLWSNSHIHTWLLENHSFEHTDFCQQR